MGGAHDAFDAPDAAMGRGHAEYSFSADAGRGGEQAPGWPGWDGLEQAVARSARGAGRVRRLGSLTSTSTARGMEDIVRHCHGHREIITDASVVELRFHSKGSFPLEQLKIKAWRGETKAGPARSGPETHGTADPSIRRWFRVRPSAPEPVDGRSWTQGLGDRQTGPPICLRSGEVLSDMHHGRDALREALHT